MKRLPWYIRRVGMMGIPEIGYRARTLFLDLVASKAGPDRPSDRACRDPWGPASEPGAGRPRFYFGKDRIALARSRLPEECSRIVQSAEEICRHRFSVFDLERICLGARIDWHYNVKDKKRIPKRPAFLLDYRNTALTGDIKYVWEINRHQHLVPLALALCLTGEKRFGQEVIDQLTHWDGENPAGVGINWTSSLEAALRLISWSWAFCLLKMGGMAPPLSLYRAMARHCAFVHSHFSLYSSRGNHLVGEAAGLSIASLLFAAEPYRSRWLRDAARILIREIHGQVYPDGVHMELSTGYHLFATELFLLPALLARCNSGDPCVVQFPRPYWERLERMLLFLHEVTDSAGLLPQIGDDDAGHCLALDVSPGRTASSLLAVGAVLFDRPEWMIVEPMRDMKGLLLLGTEATERPGGPSPSPTGRACASSEWGSAAFPHAGYYIIRTRSTPRPAVFLLFDCGPLGLEPLAGHAHADTLSFLLGIDGHPIFVDPGTYTYRTGDGLRDYFRSTSSHNTIRIDGKDLAGSGGTFLWVRKARGRLVAWRPGEEGEERATVEGSHDGYRFLKDPVLHCRRITVRKDPPAVTIEDELEARDTHRLEAFFHLDPRCEVARDHGGFLITRGDTPPLLFVPDQRWEVELVKGSRHPPLGWHSPRYGILEPAYTIVGTHTFSGTHTYRTQILVQDAPDRPIGSGGGPL